MYRLIRRLMMSNDKSWLDSPHTLGDRNSKSRTGEIGLVLQP